MYCKYCGKYIGNDSGICQDCIIAQAKTTEQPTQTINANMYQTPTTSRNTGLGYGIASAVLGFISQFAIVIGFLFIARFISEDLFVSLFCLSSIALPFMFAPIILALVFGIKAIKIARAQKRVIDKLPIATLITGISGVACAGIAIMIPAIYLTLFAYVCFLMFLTF